MSENKGGSLNNPVVYYTAHYCFCLCMHGQNSICKFNQFLRGGKDLHRGEGKSPPGPPEINPVFYIPCFNITVGCNEGLDHAQVAVDAGKMERRISVFIFILDGVLLVA